MSYESNNPESGDSERALAIQKNCRVIVGAVTLAVLFLIYLILTAGPGLLFWIG